MTESPATTPIPVQLSELDFIAFIFPHLSMPRRGPKCKLGYHRVFNLILWVLYTGMQWKCLPSTPYVDERWDRRDPLRRQSTKCSPNGLTMARLIRHSSPA